jgi:hypothetical protein
MLKRRPYASKCKAAFPGVVWKNWQAPGTRFVPTAVREQWLWTLQKSLPLMDREGSLYFACADQAHKCWEL